MKQRDNSYQYLLNEISDMDKTTFQNNWLLGLNGFPLSLSLGPLQKPLLLSHLVLGAVLEKHLKQVGGCNKQFISEICNKVFAETKVTLYAEELNLN